MVSTRISFGSLTEGATAELQVSPRAISFQQGNIEVNAGSPEDESTNGAGQGSHPSGHEALSSELTGQAVPIPRALDQSSTFPSPQMSSPVDAA
jgi:hypothetical protein